ncbi:MAG: murein transglycosylase domain-containing protein [Desulfovibrionaceae bacterium]
MNARLRLCLTLVVLTLLGCSTSDVLRAARIAATGDAAGAGRMAAEKAAGYAANPDALLYDLKRIKAVLEKFRKGVDDAWGKEERREPAPKKYVKYTQNYLSRADVDFDAGIVTVETVDQAAPEKALAAAIVTTLLTPNDPRGVDLYSDAPVALSGTPFLLGEVKDHAGSDIDGPDRAEAFAAHLLATALQERRTGGAGAKTVRFVAIAMVPDHLHVRAAKFRPLVTRWAGEYEVSGNLVYAIMRTESDFNPYAVSRVPAFGLMQVVPTSAGRDVYAFINGKSGEPSGDFLFQPANNVRYGTAYLHLLDGRYLGGVRNPVSREYCVIAAYNGGAGGVLRTFHRDKAQAVAAINALEPLEVYNRLRAKLPYEETRRYLAKVMDAKKDFINFQ